jgi:hypothetical protein
MFRPWGLSTCHSSFKTDHSSNQSFTLWGSFGQSCIWVPSSRYQIADHCIVMEQMSMSLQGNSQCSEIPSVCYIFASQHTSLPVSNLYTFAMSCRQLSLGSRESKLRLYLLAKKKRYFKVRGQALNILVIPLCLKRSGVNILDGFFFPQPRCGSVDHTTQSS